MDIERKCVVLRKPSKLFVRQEDKCMDMVLATVIANEDMVYGYKEIPTRILCC